jgi:hypothetical protein
MSYRRWILCAGFFFAAVIAKSALGYAAQSSVAAVRAQFTDSEWKQLSKITYTALILPAYVPAGFSVRSVRLERNGGGLGTEEYDVVYSNGVRAIEWDGANWQAGGDAPPQSFQATYHSGVLGSGVIWMERGGAYSPTDAGGDCWTADKEDYHLGNTLNNFGLSACDPQLSAYDAARMMNSLVLIGSGKPRPSAFDHAMQSFVVWTLVNSAGGYRLDAVSYPHDDPCAGRLSNSSTALEATLVQRVTAYYDDWNFGDLNAAWGLLSAKYRSAHNRSAWLDQHSAEAAIGVVLACPIPGERVGATIEWVDR